MEVRTASDTRLGAVTGDESVRTRWEPIPVRRRDVEPAAITLDCIYQRAMEHGRLSGLTRRTGAIGDGWSQGQTQGQSQPRSPVAGFSAARADWSPLADPSLLIVDDHTLHRENLAAVFTASGCSAPASAWDLQSLFAALTTNPPNLVLLNLDTRDSALLLHATFEICPAVRVIVLGMSEDDEVGIVACAEAGVAGYHLRTESLDDLLALIRKVADGETSCSPRVSAILLRRLSALATKRQPATQELVLTGREAQILRMLEMGLTNRDIADELCIAVHTVKNHVHSVLTKLGVSTRAEAAARFRTVSLRESDREN
jgi:DNA-binding NarL/FixJ family response regulator